MNLRVFARACCYLRSAHSARPHRTANMFCQRLVRQICSRPGLDRIVGCCHVTALLVMANVEMPVVAWRICVGEQVVPITRIIDDISKPGTKIDYVRLSGKLPWVWNAIDMPSRETRWLPNDNAVKRLKLAVKALRGKPKRGMRKVDPEGKA